MKITKLDQLRDGLLVRATIGEIEIKGEIRIEEGSHYILHNNPDKDGAGPLIGTGPWQYGWFFDQTILDTAYLTIETLDDPAPQPAPEQDAQEIPRESIDGSGKSIEAQAPSTTRKTRLYIAGPMTGIPLYNFPAFDQAAKDLRAAGYDVVNPAEMDRASGFDPVADPSLVCTPEMRRAFLSKDKAALKDCDGVALLDGWDASSGVAEELDAFSEIHPVGKSAHLSWWIHQAVPERNASESTTPPETILDLAASVTSGDRQRDYGHPRDNHACTAALWTAWLNRVAEARGGDRTLTAQDVCALNILQKVSRWANKLTRDTLVDVAGFARNAEQVGEREGGKA